MTEKNLCVVTGELINPEKVFTEGGAEKLLKPLREQLNQFVPDITTAKGRKEIASFSAKFSKSKALVDKLGKELKAEYQAKIIPIDKERKIFRDECDKMRDDARNPLTLWEEEQERIKAEEEARKQFDSDFEEALKMNILIVRERELERKEAEIHRQEEERKAREEAERLEQERLEREEQLKKEAAEKARVEAEKKAKKDKEEAERKIREFKEREDKLKREAELAEQKRLADIQAEKERAEREKQEALEKQRWEQAEQERLERERIENEKRIEAARAADIKHRKNINNSILNTIKDFCKSEKKAKELISLIVSGGVPNIIIKY